MLSSCKSAASLVQMACSDTLQKGLAGKRCIHAPVGTDSPSMLRGP